MSFEVLESFCLGKWRDSRCEDIVHEGDAFVAIIDGASSSGTHAGKSPGRTMAELVEAALWEAPRGGDHAEVLFAVNRHIRDHLGYASSREVATKGPRPTAAAIILSRAREQVWSIGDGWVMRDGLTERLEIPYSEPYTYLRCAYVDAQRRAGVEVSELLGSTRDVELIQPFLALQTEIQNNPAAGRYAYGVIDGSDDCVGFTRVFDVSGASEIVLASDGYPDLRPTLADSEVLLAEVLATDPLMIDRYPQCKPVRPGQGSYDDRSFVRLTRC